MFVIYTIFLVIILLLHITLLYYLTGDKNAVHCGVVCDVCDVPVVGFRYKCAICPNYDLCSKCETDGHHSQHIMVRFPMPKMSVSNFIKIYYFLENKLFLEKFVFKNYKCDISEKMK